MVVARVDLREVGRPLVGAPEIASVTRRARLLVQRRPGCDGIRVGRALVSCAGRGAQSHDREEDRGENSRGRGECGAANHRPNVA